MLIYGFSLAYLVAISMAFGAELKLEPLAVSQRYAQARQYRLRLVGTVVGNKRANYAIIADLNSNNAQSIVTVGDGLLGAVVVEIRNDCVILESNGRYEQLCYDYPGTAVPEYTPPRPPSELPTPSGAIVKVDDVTWRVERDWLQEIFANLGSLSTQARVAPYIVEGETLGFRFTDLKADGFVHKLGLLQGDVLQKVDGLPLNSSSEALRAYQRLQEARTLRVEILRRGESKVLTYEIR